VSMNIALEINHVTKQYITRLGVKHAVKDLSFSIHQGEVFGFLGPNGAGKTTTMKMVVGLAKPDNGSIRIMDAPAGSIEAARHFGYLPENPVFYRYLSGLEFVAMQGTLMGLTTKAAKIEAARLLDSVGLKQSKHRPIRGYSKGMVQRVGLAQALIGNPSILFLDEPLDGLDAFGRAEMKELIRELKKEQKTIFFNSHILSDVQEMCDTVGIIDHGKLLEHGSIRSLLKHHQSLEDYFVSRINQSREKSS